MLIISRKKEQSIFLSLDESVDPQTPIGDVFSGQDIEVFISDINSKTVKLGIVAPECMAVHRNELVECEEGDRKSTRLNSSHTDISRMPSSA